MRAIAFVLLAVFIHCSTSCQQNGRIKISRISSDPDFGQNFNPWLNDDLGSLVANLWSQQNFRYIDVRLDLEYPALISRLSLYDFEGSFADNPASIYAVSGTSKFLIGVFTGERYREFIDIVPDVPILADAILVHKYANNFPQKIKVYGQEAITHAPGTALPLSTINFLPVSDMLVGGKPIVLQAETNNHDSPLYFTSSDSSVIKILMSRDSVFAAPVSPGMAAITVSQNGSANYREAMPVTRTIHVTVPGAQLITGAKIPLDPDRWFQLTNASNGNRGLFDGDTIHKVETGWGKLLTNYDHFYPVLKGERIDLQSIRFYDGEGDNAKEPLTVSIINAEGQRIAVGVFNGSKYNTWVGPDPAHPENFRLQTSFDNIQYIVLNSTNFFPNEIEFIGNYISSPAASLPVKRAIPLRQMFGVNGFEWNFEAPSAPGQVDPKSFEVAKTFTGFRHYMDWEKLERVQGSYSFNPTINGGWNYDAIYDSCFAAGIEVLACLKTLPPWLLNTYPAADRDNENVPAAFGANLTLPGSYIEQAKVAFQYAARYGQNKNVDASLLHVNTQPRWFGDKVNEKKIGLGTVRYIECENERDKWWKGRKAYQTAFEYAANLSAFYDGHKNTMGAGVGVKNADPDMMVVMAGTALASTDYLKGMIDWCRRFRGYTADGSVNLCWDVINYHYYSNDSHSSQNGQATRGAAPENSGAAELAEEFMKLSASQGNNLPVWVTELGYDANQASPFKAIPIGDKSALKTQADWILRSSLLYARSGIQRIFFYGMYDDNLNNPLQFSSSGLLNENKSRKPAADFIAQVNRQFGDYNWSSTKSNNPVVDEYVSGSSQMYMLVLPSESAATATYELTLPGFLYVTIYRPVIGAAQMAAETIKMVDGKISLTVTETPLFVVPGHTVSDQAEKVLKKTSVQIVDDQDVLQKSVNIYPNPATNELRLVLKNNAVEPVTITITEASSGKIFNRKTFEKSTNTINTTIDISRLRPGYFIVGISQGKISVNRKILKQTK